MSEKLIEYGKKVKEGWKSSAKKHGLSIEIGGMDPLAHFSFDYINALALKTFFTQEMLKYGFLASTAFYASYAHSASVIDEYMAAVDRVFTNISHIQELKLSEAQFLDGPVCHSGFERLN